MSANFNLTGNAAGAVKAVEDLNKALDNSGKAGAKSAKEIKFAEEAARRFAAAADPQAKYNMQMEKLAVAVKHGGLEITKAQTLAEKYQATLSKAGNAGESAFGPKALAMFGGYAAGLVSVTGVVNAISEAFQKAEQSAQSAADAMLDSLGAVGELGQLGPEGLPKALQIQRSLIENGTVKKTQRAQAADIAANMVNAGLTDDQASLLVNDLGGAGGLVRAENLNNVGGNLKSLMTQFQEADMRDVASRVLVGANMTKADLASTSNNVLKFGSLAAAAGFDLNETVASYVASEGEAASPEAAAELQKSFWSQVYKRQLAVDGDLGKTLDNIKSLVPKGGTTFDVLGDANAVLGFESLEKNRAVLLQNLSKIAAPEPGMIKNSAGLLAATDPKARAAQLLGRAQGGLAVATDDKDTERELLFDAMRAEVDASGKRRGEWATTKYMRDWQYDTDDERGEEIKAFQGELRQGKLTGRRISAELESALVDFLKRNNALMEEQLAVMKDDSAKKQSGRVVRGPQE